MIREIPGFPGYYVSDDGKVFTSWRAGGRYTKPNGRGPNPMAQIPAGAGYLSVTLGRGRKRYVHRLVALAFHGEPPAGFEACHIDGDKTNNRADNLRWASRQDNMRDNIAQGKTTPGSKSAVAKLVESDVAVIKQLMVERVSHRALAERFSVSQATIALIATGETWKHVPNPVGFDQRTKRTRRSQ